MEKVDRLIEKANAGLNRVKIIRRDRKLALRGSFPKKSGEGRGNRQRVISLGVFANPDGVKVAIARAQRLESDLNLERFNWADWERGGSEGERSAADWGREFAEIKKGTIKSSSFDTNYKVPLAALPADKPLSEDVLTALVLSRSLPNSWDRKNDCMVYGALCKFAGVEADFSQVKGNYTPRAVTLDSVPSDDEIEATWSAISSPGWRWVYGVLATYGLRPHEAFKIVDVRAIASETGKITVMEDSKTGQRDVWPLPDRWRTHFNLAERVLPGILIEGRNNKELGERVSANLRSDKRRKIPHKPYALRHAYAIRTAVMGVPDSIAARWMGHSVAVHAQTYHAAINELHHETIWRRANQNY